MIDPLKITISDSDSSNLFHTHSLSLNYHVGLFPAAVFQGCLSTPNSKALDPTAPANSMACGHSVALMLLVITWGRERVTA